jgi:hypothetical protein
LKPFCRTVRTRISYPVVPAVHQQALVGRGLRRRIAGDKPDVNLCCPIPTSSGRGDGTERVASRSSSTKANVMPWWSGAICWRKNGRMASRSKRLLRPSSPISSWTYSAKPLSAATLAPDRSIRRNASHQFHVTRHCRDYDCIQRRRSSQGDSLRLRPKLSPDLHKEGVNGCLGRNAQFVDGEKNLPLFLRCAYRRRCAPRNVARKSNCNARRRALSMRLFVGNERFR